MDAQNCFLIPFSSTALLRSVSHSMSSHFQPGGHSVSSLCRTFSPFCGMQGCFQPNSAQPKSPLSPAGASCHCTLGWRLGARLPALSLPHRCRHQSCGSTGLQAAGPGSRTPPPRSSGARRPRRAATCAPGRCMASGAPLLPSQPCMGSSTASCLSSSHGRPRHPSTRFAS